MSKKYFFFDIDGTLTNDETHRIVPSAKLALEKLRENGHFVAIATGRIHYKAVAFTDLIGIDNVVCSGGGCLVLNNQIIKDEPMNLEIAKEILRNAEKEERGWLLLLQDTDDVYMKDYRFLTQAGFRKELTSYNLNQDLDFESLNKIFKIVLVMNEEEEKASSWISLHPYLRMTKDYIQFQHDKKKEGIIEMMQYMNGPIEDVVVFGDGKNDLCMFDDRWTSIAMGNACDALKEKADYVTDKNIDDGIFNACKHFGWIE